MGALVLRAADLRDFDGEARVQDLRLGEVLGYGDPKKVRQIIRRNRDELFAHGVLAQSEAKPLPGSVGGRPERSFLLNEAQAVLVTMFSRTERAAEARRQIVSVFLAHRHGRPVPAPALPKPARRMARRGRGQLSSIEMLPAMCAKDVAWAIEALGGRQLTQLAIAAELNRRIVAKGCRAISKSAFGRFSMRLSLDDERGSRARIQVRNAGPNPLITVEVR